MSIAIGRRYARALWDLGEEQKQTPAIRAGIEKLAAAWSASEELQALFENPAVKSDQRKQVLGALSKRLGLPKLLENTLNLLADRRRLRFVPEISEAYLGLAAELGGLVRAEVTTATAMPEAYYLKLQKTLEEATGKKVTLVKKQDPTLIAGVVTRVGDMVFDGSVRSRLQDLRTSLMDAQYTTEQRVSLLNTSNA